MSVLKSNLQCHKPIGAGHFGEVFLGTDDVHGEVAVKVIGKRPEWSDAQWQAAKAGFFMEAQNLKKAQHRNVVEVYHIVERDTDDAIQYAMQYCPGGSLVGRYETGPMTLAEVRDVATQVSLGLGALHGRGMIHRDIKPGNILIDGTGVAKIGDFGFVTDQLMYGYAEGGGYLDHLAPEFWALRIASVKTDIWALGMTLYRLLHGKTWYSESPAPRDLVPQGRFADTLEWLPHVPKKWRRVIRTMLRDDPADRYQSMDQVMVALADLPVDPNWSCAVGDEEVTWSLDAGRRTKKVVWRRHSPRKHEWEAWSEPQGRGNRYTLGGSGGIVGLRKALDELEGFFSG